VQPQVSASFARDRDLKGGRNVWYSIDPDRDEPVRLVWYPGGFTTADGTYVLPGGKVLPCEGIFYLPRNKRPPDGWLIRFLRRIHAV
jgi:hypothetical protein